MGFFMKDDEPGPAAEDAEKAKIREETGEKTTRNDSDSKISGVAGASLVTLLLVALAALLPATARAECADRPAMARRSAGPLATGRSAARAAATRPAAPTPARPA